MTQPPDRRVIVPALGITQIFAWGSTFYLPAALAPLIASDTGWPYDLTVGGVSVGLLVAGLASPRIGQLIADKGGRPVLAIGALLLAAGLVGIGTASNLPWYLAGWLVIGLGMSASLYDAAFSTLGGIYGESSRTPITAVTLFGGFARAVNRAWIAESITHILAWHSAIRPNSDGTANCLTEGGRRSYVGGMERQEQNPTVDVLDRLAETLGVSISELFRRPRKSALAPRSLRRGRKPRPTR
jgi:MFS family permease